MPDILATCNALFVTYLATEYIIASDSHRNPWKQLWASKMTKIGGCLAVLANTCARLHIRLSGATAVSAADGALRVVSHVPRIAFAALAYVLALFFDCRRSQPSITVGALLRKVGSAFCRVAPIYPFLAVLISFVFLFVISFFEALHLPLEWLNMPIYYGTLYGPFSAIYWNVKMRVLEDRDTLPTTAETGTPAGAGWGKRDACLTAALRRTGSAVS